MGQAVEPQILKTDEHGQLTLPAKLLGDAKPFSRFKVEAVGTKLSVEPEVTDKHREQTLEEWEQQWKVVQEQVSKSWPAGVSAADIISEMRR